MLQDVAPGGNYWSKLAAGAANIEVRTLTSLNEILMDDGVETIAARLFPQVAGVSPSMWPAHVRLVAFGAPITTPVKVKSEPVDAGQVDPEADTEPEEEGEEETGDPDFVDAEAIVVADAEDNDDDR